MSLQALEAFDVVAVFRSWKLITRPGLEPGKTEPKSVVLPITLPGYFCSGSSIVRPIDPMPQSAFVRVEIEGFPGNPSMVLLDTGGILVVSESQADFAELQADFVQ